jgi:hypothetical protein
LAGIVRSAYFNFLEKRVKPYLEECPIVVNESNYCFPSQDYYPPSREAERKLSDVVRSFVANFDLTEDQALEFLVTHYNPRCEPPFDRGDFIRIAWEAYRFTQHNKCPQNA